MKRSVSLKGLGELTLTIAFKTDRNGKEVFARSFTRLVEPEHLTIWQVVEFSRLQLTLLDFLAGKPTGDYNYGILGGRGWDSSLRLMGRKRGKADKKSGQTRTTLRANKRETIEWLKFTLEGAGERTHGYAFEDPAF